MVEKPILKALILADHVHTDRATGKNTIIGVFDRLFSSSFPGTLGVVTYGFLKLANVRRTIRVQLRYVDLKENRVLLETVAVPVKSNDPVGNVEMAIQIPPFPMPHPGVYAFEVYVDGEMIGDERISADLGEKR